MKFPDFKSGNATICHIDGISKGITSQIGCRDNKNLGLADCKNVIFKDGFLKNRLGLFANSSNRIENSEYSGNLSSDVTTTGIEVETYWGTVKMLRK